VRKPHLHPHSAPSSSAGDANWHNDDVAGIYEALGLNAEVLERLQRLLYGPKKSLRPVASARSRARNSKSTRVGAFNVV
jgi:hypothetical protein